MKEYLAWNIYYIMDPIVYIFDGWSTCRVGKLYFNKFFLGSRIVLYNFIVNTYLLRNLFDTSLHKKATENWNYILNEEAIFST